MISQKTFSSISDSSSEINEDDFGFTTTTAWVLDGATSISGRRQSVGGKLVSDASWFVSQFSQGLFGYRGGHLIDYLQSVLISINSIGQSQWSNWSDSDTPSASFSYSKIEGNGITLLNLGDCKVHYQLDGAEVMSFGSSRVQLLDEQLLESYKFLRTSPIVTHEQAWKVLVPQIRENRTLMNKENGYWILSPDGSGLKMMQSKKLIFERSAKIFLSTDGLFRLVDTYHQVSVDEYFSEAFSENGLKRLLQLLREIEGNDLKSVTYPRVKLRDDATGLAISYEKRK